MCATCGCGDDGATITAMWGYRPLAGDARTKSSDTKSGHTH